MRRVPILAILVLSTVLAPAGRATSRAPARLSEPSPARHGRGDRWFQEPRGRHRHRRRGRRHHRQPDRPQSRRGRPLARGRGRISSLEYGQAGSDDALGQSPDAKSRADRLGQALPAGERVLPALHAHDLCRRPAADGARHGMPPGRRDLADHRLRPQFRRTACSASRLSLCLAFRCPSRGKLLGGPLVRARRASRRSFSSSCCVR